MAMSVARPVTKPRGAGIKVMKKWKTKQSREAEHRTGDSNDWLCPIGIFLYCRCHTWGVNMKCMNII